LAAQDEPIGGITQAAAGPTAPAIIAFSPNPSQTLFEKLALGCVNDAKADVVRDGGQGPSASSQRNPRRV